MLQAQSPSPAGCGGGTIQAVGALRRLFQYPERPWFMSYLIIAFPFLRLPCRVC